MLEGQVTRILFRDEASLFTALKVRPLQGGRDVSVVGELLNVAVDDEFTFTGQWVRHAKWGPQFQVAYALARGHNVTLFNRGKRPSPEWPGEVEQLLGDRPTRQAGHRR